MGRPGRGSNEVVIGRSQELMRVPLLQEHDEDDSDEGNLLSRDQSSSGNLNLLEDGLSRRNSSRRLERQKSRRSSLNPVTRRRSQDYRSEGEQPSTARNGVRKSMGKFTKQDSFRAARMPKRGGRKRLRRVRSVQRKFRVSSYCVSRELQTLELLRWLESQPNRRLAQSLRDQGGTVPQGPVGAANFGKSTSTAMPGTQVGTLEDAMRPRRSYDPLEVEVEGSKASGSVAMTAAGPRSGFAVDASKIAQLEWMDSLYIDIIHSTTDLRGGLRKARELTRPAWDPSSGESSSPYVYELDDDDGHDKSRGADGDEEDDDDSLTHKDIMFFPYGAVVFWGCSEVEEKEILSSLRRFIVGQVTDTEFAESFDDMTFVYRQRGSGKSVPLKNDEITLDTRDPAEKLAYSCALAQSAKLFVFEERLNGTIESTAKYPQMLADTGKIPLNEVQIGCLVGKVLCEQNEVNLQSDILDTPEYFWEDDVWEPAYQALCAYLDIPLRVDNVNKRLSILRELLDVLSTQSTNAHATRLEVIIIYLIFVEVAIELVWNVVIKDILHLVEGSK